ncbi:MAG: phosphodiester glycosidase family protein [Atopobiaceae bacterium]|nr:phosphodiester glycosidase family protein [Atopobiaceae bacterium]
MRHMKSSPAMPASNGGHQSRRRFPLVAVYAVVLLCLSVYVLLDTFVITRSYAQVATNTQEAAAAALAATAQATDEDNASVKSTTVVGGTEDAAESTEVADSGVTTSLSQVRYNDTTIYVVDVYASDATQVLTAFASGTYGKNVTDTTSAMAEAAGATVAINGDYYGARNAGYVVRNGVLYRSEAASASQEDLVIYADGTFEVVCEGDVSAQDLVDAGAWQVFSFGPGLVVNGAVAVDANDEVGRAMASNPRTAIGKVSDGHYVLVVSDGRTNESEGLTLQELATFMVDELGVQCAYNLDGGGSSTLWYEGTVVNNPTTNGRSIHERSVSDIVYLRSE